MVAIEFQDKAETDLGVGQRDQLTPLAIFRK